MQTLTFQPFDTHRAVRKYWRDLPHWRQEGATYFVTFRLWDSLPQHAVKFLETLRRSVARHAEDMARWAETDRRIFRQLKRYLDAGFGACFMRDARARAAVHAALVHFDHSRYHLGAIAIMPNHVHVLVTPTPDYALEKILHSWKSYTAKAINRIFERTGRVWQEEAYDRIVRDLLELKRTERYINRQISG